ncbi:putative GNAT family acetyltransferase [Coniochaeta sp. 2T2.1]|nr:putative GNAT family acetyltransferase [Coniochaeta sp. 2T2.1]
MTKLHFRAATAPEASRIHQLVESAFRAEDSRPQWTADMSLGRSFRLDIQHITTPIENPDGAVLVACDQDNNLIASVQVSKRTEDLARIALLAVDENHQRSGIGHRLLDYAEEYCRNTWGVDRMGLNALSTREELILWYTRCGYQKTGEVTPFRPPRDDETLPDNLFFVEMEKQL